MRTIETLDPTKMDSMCQKTYDISRKQNAIFHIPKVDSPLAIKYGYHQGHSRDRFPPNSVGVLYYHHPLDQPVLTGAVRVRLCSNVICFDEGEDLKYALGEPWHVNLYDIARRKQWHGLRRMLLEESLVDEPVITDLQKLPEINTKANLHYELGQPFVLDLEHPNFTRTFFTRSMKYHFSFIPLYRLFQPYIRRHSGVPYTGRVLVRFELFLAKSPEPRLALRILDVLTPVQCLDPVYECLEPPVPGKLLRSSTKRFSRQVKARPLFHPLRTKNGGKDIAEFAGIPFPWTPS
ncbi:hypothetical protein CPB84DRAFT_1201094 [Gymnopilus junonius]|uniref:Uncharacterized protein n=1 Tax=Gymnopilus junonius TaxID=109634 RepID=A0A9P5TME6_GYMJU|nr:hypothetical protein CPB84DRAFT_1201094 [Gymnopilus junonius]